MKILFIGDIFGHVGRRACQEMIPKLKEKYGIDYVIANAENTTNGKGLSLTHYEELSKAGIDFFTMGNHTWDNNEIYQIFLNKNNIIRPGNVTLNVPEDYALSSKLVVKNNLKIRITNLMGLTVTGKRFVSLSPFIFFMNFMEELKGNDDADIHIVDYHGETTAEKAAFFHMFDGQVSAILGTHTHVQTNDAQISDLGTAFITEVGMTGAKNSIIGALPKPILDFYKGVTDHMYINAGDGKFQFSCVILTIDEKTKKISSIQNELIYED